MILHDSKIIMYNFAILALSRIQTTDYKIVNNLSSCIFFIIYSGSTTIGYILIVLICLKTSRLYNLI